MNVRTQYYSKYIISITKVRADIFNNGITYWGVWTGRLLDHKETQEQMMDGMINKMK